MMTELYSSWSAIQQEKFGKMRRRLHPELLARMLRNRLVLDIGCGNGYFQKAFEGHYIGVDNDETMLRKAVAIFPMVLGDGNSLPFADYSFDTVISIDTMHLIKTQDFKRVLRPGGIVMFSIFFNDDNYEERRQMLLGKLRDFIIIEELTIDSKEKEYVVVAEKPTFH